MSNSVLLSPRTLYTLNHLYVLLSIYLPTKTILVYTDISAIKMIPTISLPPFSIYTHSLNLKSFISPFSAVVYKQFIPTVYSHSYLKGNSSLLSNLGCYEAAWLCESVPRPEMLWLGLQIRTLDIWSLLASDTNPLNLGDFIFLLSHTGIKHTDLPPGMDADQHEQTLKKGIIGKDSNLSS